MAAPLLYCGGLFVLELVDPHRRASVVNDLAGNVGIVVAFGAPIAYAATVLVALPALWLLARLGGLTLSRTMIVGLITGVAVGYVIVPSLSGDLFRIRFSLWAAGAIGVVSAGVWWRFARSR